MNSTFTTISMAFGVAVILIGLSVQADCERRTENSASCGSGDTSCSDLNGSPASCGAFFYGRGMGEFAWMCIPNNSGEDYTRCIDYCIWNPELQDCTIQYTASFNTMIVIAKLYAIMILMRAYAPMTPTLERNAQKSQLSPPFLAFKLL